MHSKLKTLTLAALFSVLVVTSTSADESTNDPDPFRPFPDQLAPSLFNEVEDRYEFGIRPEEKTLYYYVLKHLGETSLKDQQQAAEFNLQSRRAELKAFKDHPERKLPLFPDIFKNSKRYKGRLVTLTGRVRKLVHYPAEENGYGIKTLYEAWLFTDDSQQNPTVVICTEVPPALKDGLPEGVDVIDHVTVTGYLFKMYVYNAQDTTRVAPLILAKQLQWTPAGVDEKGSQLFSQLLAGTLVLLIIGVAIAMWKASQKDKQIREARLQSSQEKVSFDKLDAFPAAATPEIKPPPEMKSSPATDAKPETETKTTDESSS